jgi:hypothetical protein
VRTYYTGVAPTKEENMKKRRAASLFESEMRKPSFRRRFEAERESFALEVQFLNLLESGEMTLADFARRTGVPRANITRDLSQQGIRNATLPRVSRMAEVVDADFVPVILPRDPKKRREVFDRLQRAYG